MHRLLAMGVVGVCFGFVLHRIGLVSAHEIERMFLLSDLRIPLTLITTAAILIPFYLSRADQPDPIRMLITWRTVVGATLFGAGWVLCGVCPLTVLPQIGSGYLPGLLALAGVCVGILLHQGIQKRWLPGESVLYRD